MGASVQDEVDAIGCIVHDLGLPELTVCLLIKADKIQVVQSIFRDVKSSMPLLMTIHDFAPSLFMELIWISKSYLGDNNIQSWTKLGIDSN